MYIENDYDLSEYIIVDTFVYEFINRMNTYTLKNIFVSNNT